MDNRPLVLVAADEPQITKLVAMTLTEEGFRVVTARDGEEAIDKAASMRPDAVVLDLVTPGMSGIEVMDHLREWHPFPVILLSGRTSKADVATGLDAGADDYIPKPLHPRELAARVRAVLRRVSRVSPARSVVQIGDYEVDLTKRVVTRNGEFVPFSRTEWLLLQHLATNVGRVMTHAELLTEVWGPEYRDDLTYLRLWIGRLRRKLGVEPGHEGPIRTFQGLGYALDTEGVLERQPVQVLDGQGRTAPGLTSPRRAVRPHRSLSPPFPATPAPGYSPRRARDLRLTSLSLSSASAGDARARVGPNPGPDPSARSPALAKPGPSPKAPTWADCCPIGDLPPSFRVFPSRGIRVHLRSAHPSCPARRSPGPALRRRALGRDPRPWRSSSISSGSSPSSQSCCSSAPPSAPATGCSASPGPSFAAPSSSARRRSWSTSTRPGSRRRSGSSRSPCR